MKRFASILALCLMLPNIWAKKDDIELDFIKANESFVSGNYTKAITELRNIYETVSSNQDKYIVAQSLSSAYIASGKYKEAESLLLNTLHSVENDSIKDSSLYRELITSISLVYFELHNYNKANRYIQKAKNLFEENLDFGYGYVRCLSIMAGLQVELGYKTLGRMLIDVAVRQAKDNYKNPSQEPDGASGNLLSNLTREKLHNFRVAQYAQLLSNASAIYDRIGYIGDAVSLIKEAIFVSESIGVELTYCYNNLAGIYLDKSDYRKAIDNYEKALSLANTPYAFDEISMSLSFAKIFANDKDVADITFKNSEVLKAHQQYAFSFLSDNERRDYWENSGHNISLQNYIYQQKGDKKFNGAIYNNILYYKGLLLRATNTTYNSIALSDDSEMKGLYRSILKFKTLMANESDPTIINILKQKCDSIDKILVRFYGQKKESTSSEITWQDVQAKLKDTDIAIEFYCIPNIVVTNNYAESKADGTIYCAATLKKNYKTPHIFQLLSSKELAKLFADAPYGSVELYDRIWKPLKNELEGAKNIYFSADRDLHKIPLESLMDNANRPACTLWNIYRLSSTRELASPKKEVTRKHYALFGGLNYSAKIEDLEEAIERKGLRSGSTTTTQNRTDSTSLYRAGMRYLPGTKMEVESIKNELKQNKKVVCELYTGLDGTEEMLKSLSGKDVNVIHLATHGYYWTKPEANKQKGISKLIQNKDKSTSALLRSGILMSGANHSLRGETLPDNIEDGIATAQEISNLNYRNVDLVVLSACQSALGETNGEGVYGLQRGLKLAGVHSILMTLWPIDDQATQMLMIEFYKNLINGNSKVASLKNAQNHIRLQAGYESPEYWAGFILLDGLN